jgi:hypothetical protein
VAVSELVLVEFYTLLRNPAVLRHPLDAADAVLAVQSYRRHPRWTLLGFDPDNVGLHDELWTLAGRTPSSRGGASTMRGSRSRSGGRASRNSPRPTLRTSRTSASSACGTPSSRPPTDPDPVYPLPLTLAARGTGARAEVTRARAPGRKVPAYGSRARGRRDVKSRPTGLARVDNSPLTIVRYSRIIIRL